MSAKEEEDMEWETPEYTIVEVCAEVTGYFYRG
jgi:coenzyme PQQ precursor peptide PqqA